MMYHLQQTDTSGKVHLIPAIKVSMTAEGYKDFGLDDWHLRHAKADAKEQAA